MKTVYIKVLTIQDKLNPDASIFKPFVITAEQTLRIEINKL